MNKSMQQLLDYSEQCLSKATMFTDHHEQQLVNSTISDFWQKQSRAASALALALAQASAVANA